MAVSQSGSFEPQANKGNARPMRFTNKRLRQVGLALVLACSLSSVFTFLTMIGKTFLVPTHNVVLGAGIINFSLVLLLLGVIGFEIYGLVRAKKRGYAGARLHLRMAGLFSVIAAFPAILLAIAASMTLDIGLDRWFGERTKNIIENSQNVAQSYLNEHGAVIRTDILAIARDIERLENRVLGDEAVRRDFLNQQAILRRLPGVYLLTEDLQIVDQATVAENYPYEPPPPASIEGAKTGDLIFLSPGRRNLVGAVLKLKIEQSLYIYVNRPVNQQVMEFLRQTEAEAQEYKLLEARRAGIQLAFGLLYLMIAAVVMSIAVWAGIGVSNWIVSPLRRLIYAADQVSHGNFYVEVPVQKRLGDFASLGQSFNTMTNRLRQQRSDLLETNDKLNKRSQFMQAVLSGVSAGVLGLDEAGVIKLANRPALDIFAASGKQAVIGKSLKDILPQAWASFERAQKNQSRRNAPAEVDYQTANGVRNLTVRVTSEAGSDTSHGYVVTIDDVTDLVNAQRTSAWADVARRIAHEIKNPLTPIQLSAERIRRKYGKMIADDDREVFDQCTNTIVRQVEDIGRMVDEFSSFAQMPKPQFGAHDINEIVKQTIFLMRVGRENAEFPVSLPADPIVAKCDRRLISQALTNVIKNALEAIEENKQNGVKPIVEVRLLRRNGMVIIEIEDNGKGLPVDHRARLMEPYMTTREKGTGLGLAIVRKIMEDHGGWIELDDSPKAQAKGETGAMITLVFAENPNETKKHLSENKAENGEENGK